MTYPGQFLSTSHEWSVLGQFDCLPMSYRSLQLFHFEPVFALFYINTIPYPHPMCLPDRSASSSPVFMPNCLCIKPLWTDLWTFNQLAHFPSFYQPLNISEHLQTSTLSTISPMRIPCLSKCNLPHSTCFSHQPTWSFPILTSSPISPLPQFPRTSMLLKPHSSLNHSK